MVCLTFYKFHTNVSPQFSPIEFRSKSTVPKTSPITTEFLTGFVLICSIILGNLKCCSLFSLTTDDNDSPPEPWSERMEACRLA